MFRKLMPVAKKPWAKDVTETSKKNKRDIGDIKVTSDEFTEESNNEEADEDDDYEQEYYDDRFFRSNESKQNSMRFSLIADMTQASLYFDYKMSNRDLMGDASPAKSTTRNAANNPRRGMGKGIVPTPSILPKPAKTKQEVANIPAPRNARDARPGVGPRAGAPAPRGARVNSMLAAMSVNDTIEEEQEESSDEDPYSDDIKMVRVRSLSPEMRKREVEAPPEPNGRRAQLVKRNSWTSSRQIEKVETEDINKKPEDGKKTKKKKKKGASDGTKDKKKQSDASSKSKESRTNSKTKKKKSNDGGQSMSSSGSVARSSSNNESGANPKSTRKKLQRSSSWTSSRGLNADTNFTTGKLSSSNKRNSDLSKGRGSAVSPEEELHAIIGSPSKSAETPGGLIKLPRLHNRVGILEQLKKTKDFCSSMAHLTKKKDFDEGDLSNIQEQLADALRQVELMTVEQEHAMNVISTATSEVDDLKAMLAESAKENNELHDRLALIQSKLGDGECEIERHKQNFELALEEKNALADDMNRTEVELRTLRSRIRGMEARASALGVAPTRTSTVTGLQNDAYAQAIQVTSQAQKIGEQQKKIEALEQRILEGGGEDAQKALKLVEEVEQLKKEQKDSRMQMSVQNAKKDAMIAGLQRSASEANENIKQLKASKIKVDEELKNVKAQLMIAEEEVETTTTLHERIKELEARLSDAEIVERGLQDAIDKWTDKTFEWKEKAEGHLEELMKLKEGSDEIAEGSINPAKQAWGLF